MFTCRDGKGCKLSSQVSKMLYKRPGANYIALYKELLDQSNCWKLFVQLWNYTNIWYAHLKLSCFRSVRDFIEKRLDWQANTLYYPISSQFWTFCTIANSQLFLRCVTQLPILLCKQNCFHAFVSLCVFTFTFVGVCWKKDSWGSLTFLLSLFSLHWHIQIPPFPNPSIQRPYDILNCQGKYFSWHKLKAFTQKGRLSLFKLILFSRIELIYGRLTCFDMKRIVLQLFLLNSVLYICSLQQQN